ncbi:MAG TPA: TIGR02647 family protein [Fluviicoccus sp.]|nr:TIGR02647 family protein [Fluviicoccus sp.]
MLTLEMLDELHVLTLFNPDNGQEGIKVHHSAEPATISACKRLYSRGMVTLPDGGYLTPLGAQTLEHAQSLLALLSSPVNAD